MSFSLLLFLDFEGGKITGLSTFVAWCQMLSIKKEKGNEIYSLRLTCSKSIFTCQWGNKPKVITKKLKYNHNIIISKGAYNGVDGDR